VQALAHRKHDNSDSSVPLSSPAVSYLRQGRAYLPSVSSTSSHSRGPSTVTVDSEDASGSSLFNRSASPLQSSVDLLYTESMSGGISTPSPTGGCPTASPVGSISKPTSRVASPLGRKPEVPPKPMFVDGTFIVSSRPGSASSSTGKQEVKQVSREGGDREDDGETERTIYIHKGIDLLGMIDICLSDRSIN